MAVACIVIMSRENLMYLPNSKSIDMVALEFFFNIHAGLVVTQSETWIFVNFPTLEPVQVQ